MQKRTLWERKRAGDNQRWEWDSVDAETHSLWAETRVSSDAQGMISDGNETLSMQKRTSCEQKRAEGDQRREWDSVDAETHSLWAATRVSSDAQGMITDGNETLSMQVRTHCDRNACG